MVYTVNDAHGARNMIHCMASPSYRQGFSLSSLVDDTHGTRLTHARGDHANKKICVKQYRKIMTIILFYR